MVFSISRYYFEMFSFFLEWVVRYETVLTLVIHYLDNFLFIAPGNSDACRYMLDTFRFLMKHF